MTSDLQKGAPFATGLVEGPGDLETLSAVDQALGLVVEACAR
ncbi:MAG: hypothetical protein ACM3ST_11420 [Bdellovibrio bacteriovorus]